MSQVESATSPNSGFQKVAVLAELPPNSRIIAEVEVPLPHPRVPEIRTDPEFTRVVREVVTLLGSAAESTEEE